MDSAIEAAIPAQTTEKRKLDDTTANKTSAPKRIVLNRNPSVSSETQNGGTVTATAIQEKSDGNAEKKIIKLSELSVKEVGENIKIFLTTTRKLHCVYLCFLTQ